MGVLSSGCGVHCVTSKMEDGLKIGIFTGVIIYLLRRRKNPTPEWNPPDIHHTPHISEPNPAEVPPPNVDGCIIPPTTEGQEAILKDPKACGWIIRTKTTLAELPTDYKYDPYLDSTSWVPVNPLEATIQNM